MMKLFTAVAAAVLSVASLSADSFFRVDISMAKNAPKAKLTSPADKNVNLKLGPMGFAQKAEQPYTLTGETQIKDKDGWKNIIFTVKAEKDTKIRVSYRGNWASKPANMSWSYVADFKVDGALIANGDLSKRDKSGRVLGFESQHVKNFFPAAKKGEKNAFLVHHNHDLVRLYELKGGKTYVFTVAVKAGKAPAAKK